MNTGPSVMRQSRHICNGCGEEYSTARFLDAHEKERCATSKRTLSELLGQTKHLWEVRKRRKAQNAVEPGADALRLEPRRLLHPSPRRSTTNTVSVKLVSPGPPSSLASLVEQSPKTTQGIHAGVSVEAAQGAIGASSSTARRAPGEARRSNGMESTGRLNQATGTGAIPFDPLEEDILPERLAPYEGVILPQSEYYTSVIDRDEHRSIAASGSSNLRTASWWHSKPNKFSLWRRYYGHRLPSHDADGVLEAEDFDDVQTPADQVFVDDHPSASSGSRVGPFPNQSSFLLADWWWNGQNEKSAKEFSKLLALIKTPGFSFEDLVATNWKSSMAAFDAGNYDDDATDEWLNDSRWHFTPVEISVPFHRYMRGSGIEKRTVGVLQHRKIVAVIEDKIRNLQGKSFHYHPSQVVWSPPCDPSTEAIHFRVQGELYNSDAFLEAHRKLQDAPPLPGCNRERVVVALMLWSDETHLSSFGTAKLWPCYMFFGNDSKYRRSKTSLKLCEHIAYFDTVSQSNLLPYALLDPFCIVNLYLMLLPN
jgi:Plavaka transposase